MREATKKEVVDHQKRLAAAEAAWRKRAERAAFNARNEGRKKSGLKELTLDEFRSEEQAEMERRRTDQKAGIDLARTVIKRMGL